MSEFERALPKYRLVETHHGDDLQAVAHRELGDANRWPELAWINELVYPYLTDDEARVAAGVLLNGSMLKVPAPTGFTEDKSSTEDVYERDCELRGKLLQVDEHGDFAVVAGVDNLTQQLRHAIDTPRGQARRHPEYGCLVWRLHGKVNGPMAGMLGAAYVKATLEADYRVVRAPSSQASIEGDVLRVAADAETLSGGTIRLRTESEAS